MIKKEWRFVGMMNGGVVRWIDNQIAVEVHLTDAQNGVEVHWIEVAVHLTEDLMIRMKWRFVGVMIRMEW